MPDEDEITDAIAESAAEPKSVTIDGYSTTGHSLPDLIEADKYLRARTAQQSSGPGIKFFKLIPPGIS